MNDDRPPDSDVEPLADLSQVESTDPRIAVEQIHRLLASARRRYVLSHLSSSPGEDVPLDDVVTAVVEREHPDPGPLSHRDRVETDLHHVHLPKLADSGVVSHDPEAGTVRYEPSEAVETLLAVSEAFGERTE